MPPSKNQSRLHALLARWTLCKEPSMVVPVTVFHLNVFLYALAFWIQQPLLPFITSSLGANSEVYGYLQSFVSLLAFVSGPVMGAMVDHVGAVDTLIFAQLGSAVTYFTLGHSSTLPLLFMSRLFTVTQNVMQTAQAFVDGEEGMGRLSMSYGLGMVVGSSLGAVISKNLTLTASAYVAASISVAAAVGTTVFHRTGAMHERRAEDDADSADSKKKKSSGGLDLSALVSIVRAPAMQRRLAVVLCVSMGIGMQHSMLGMILKDVFGFSPSMLSFYISYAALVSTAANTWLVAPLKKRYSVRTLTRACGLLLAVCFVLFAFLCVLASNNSNTNNNIIVLLCVLTVPQSMSSSLLYLMLTGIIKNSVDAKDVGKAVSISHAVRSFVGVIAPIIAGVCMAHVGVWAVPAAGAFVTAFSTLMFSLE
eukprot:PhM_4_TR13251/c0_g3_i1/m.100930/K08214/SLC22A18; MFS transporter, OCT family, solute carrier family 22 (organic cation transporter), member 18